MGRQGPAAGGVASRVSQHLMSLDLVGAGLLAMLSTRLFSQTGAPVSRANPPPQRRFIRTNKRGLVNSVL